VGSVAEALDPMRQRCPRASTLERTPTWGTSVTTPKSRTVQFRQERPEDERNKEPNDKYRC
jgi:hypothetical protein